VSGLSFSGWGFLLLLPLIPLGWWLASRRRVRVPYTQTSLLRSASSPLRWLWWYWQPVLRTAALVLILAALLQPQRLFQKVEEVTEGVAIVLVVDISSSMLAEDFRPENRLAIAKREVQRFIDGRAEDWIGLVSFSGEALTVIPGTLDHDLVLTAVEELDVGQLRDGTAIGVALATAANRLRGLESSSKVVILLTDGDNNSGTIAPLDAAGAAEALGIRVYTIGIGRDGVAPVPIARTAYGYQYANVQVRVNEELLESIASSTGGLYFRAWPSGFFFWSWSARRRAGSGCCTHEAGARRPGGHAGPRASWDRGLAGAPGERATRRPTGHPASRRRAVSHSHRPSRGRAGGRDRGARLRGAGRQPG
jgi:Ca-activated chloride channel family protein